MTLRLNVATIFSIITKFEAIDRVLTKKPMGRGGEGRSWEKVGGWLPGSCWAAGVGLKKGPGWKMHTRGALQRGTTRRRADQRTGQRR